MIYVEEKTFDRQLELIDFISKSNKYELVAWAYPESELKEIFGQKIIQSDLEAVTTYEDGVIPRHSIRVSCSPELIKIIKGCKPIISKHCDSLALYKPKENNWQVACVGHEGMTLIKGKTMLNKLKLAGFNVSTEAPSWW